MRSPCHRCRVHYTSADKELHPVCKSCAAARAYSDSIGPMVCGSAESLSQINPPYLINADPPKAVAYPFDVVEDVCEKYRVPPEALSTTKSAGRVARARAEIVRRLSSDLKMTEAEISEFVGVTQAAVVAILNRLSTANQAFDQ